MVPNGQISRVCFAAEQILRRLRLLALLLRLQPWLVLAAMESITHGRMSRIAAVAAPASLPADIPQPRVKALQATTSKS